ncbi:MAG TPA: phage major capsid protein [Hyphomicrobiaceae bacterium]|nr:phage major capsid protein [Hyphomicrobiaceae bacterium]
MPYNSVIGRSDVAGMIPVEYSYELIQSIPQASHVLRLARRLRDMTVYEERLPVMSALATAYFVDGDTELVQTSEVNWENKYVYAKDLAVIVPIPRTVLNDSKVPLWEQVKPECQTAIGLAIDNAVLYGTNKPSVWPDAIITGAASASHNVSEAAFADLYDAILGDSGLFSLVEQDGYGVTGSIAHLMMKGKLRGTRDANGQPIFTRDPVAAAQYNLDGAPIYFPTNGAGNSTYRLVAGDWSQLVYSMRQDMEFEVYTEGIIQDAGGNIIYNLMQQRMAAIMLVMRLGFALPNPINRVNGTAATRYPFAYLTA